MLPFHVIKENQAHMGDRVRPGSNPPFLCPLFNEADRRMDLSGGFFDGGPSFSWLSEHENTLSHVAWFFTRTERGGLAVSVVFWEHSLGKWETVPTFPTKHLSQREH
jgi:hypothetical protein